jgi:g-D-glutamyl-meso-diaminopimelate peptidase
MNFLVGRKERGMKIAKIYITTFICLISFVLFTSFPAKAEEIFVETVTKTDIYKKQGSTFIKIGTLREKEPLKVLSSLNEKYYTVQFGEQTAYILKESVKPVEKLDNSLFTEKGNKTYFQMYTIKSTPVYYFQGGERKELAIIEKNVPFSMIEENGDFYQIIVAGRKAYIDKNNVHFIFPQNDKSFQVAVKSVPVYYNKSGKFVEVGLLKQGQTFYSKSEYNGQWHVIEFGQLTGYVPKTGIKPITQKITPVSSEPFMYLVKVGKEIDVYNSTSKTRVAIATIQPGQVFAAKKLVGNFYEIVIAGKTAYLSQSAVNDKIDNKGIVNPYQTYTYEQMQRDIQRLQSFYPGLVQTQIIGHSVEGRNIYAIKLGKGKREIFVNASHHAREHITTNLVMEMIDTYAFAYGNNQKIDNYSIRKTLDNTSIWFVPMVNPDGVTLVQKGYKAVKNSTLVLKINNGKKDFSAWKANIRGVDLNRQYDAYWKTICCNPGKPWYKNYKGPRPYSEPEAQAMRDFTLAHNFLTTVSYHSSGQIIYWHFHQSKEQAQRDYRLALMLSKKTKYSLVKPEKNPSGGGYKDWFVIQFKRPGFTIEVAPYVGECPVPLKYFPSIWSKNNSIPIMLANAV